MFNRWKGERVIDKAHDLWDTSGDVAATSASEANSFIHRKPLAATLISIGAGLCFGMFWGSLSRRAPSTVETSRPRIRASAKATKPRRR